jgi:hypothetical protein
MTEEPETHKALSIFADCPAFDRLVQRAAENEALISDLLTPEAKAKLDAAEADLERRIIGG